MEGGKKVKVGVIGVGALGRHHARLYAANPGAQVVGIFDVQKDSALKVAGEFGLKVFDTWQALAAECDALSVAVPANWHGTSVLPLLEMKKHVLVEKPIAASVPEAERMVRAARENGVVLGVGHVERFNPAMGFIEKNHGPIRFIEAHRMAKFPPPRPGLPPRGTEVSVILDLMIHDIDLALSLIDADVERFDVVGLPVLSGSEDIVNARIKFTNGSQASLTASRVSQEPKRKFRIFQEDGCIAMDFNSRSGMVVKCENGELRRTDVTLEERNALADELDDFLCTVRRTLETGVPARTRVPGEDGLKALKLAAAFETEARRYNKQYGVRTALDPDGNKR